MKQIKKGESNWQKNLPGGIADLIMKNGFLLGAHHGMTLEDVDYVCDKIKEYVNLRNQAERV